jgi:Ketosteroid isomerase homolog
MSAEEEVRSASKNFYTALNQMANGDATSMADGWSHSPDVTAMHPINGREMGWDAVNASFGQFAQAATDGAISLKDQVIRVNGDVAYEIGTEQGRCKFGGHPVELNHRVTNIYRREDGGWRMIHHHSDTSPAMLDVLSKMGGPAE